MKHDPLLPPQNLEAERAVLGACMLNKQAVAIAAERLRPADFYRPEHAKMFTACMALFDAGKPVDLLTVTDALRAAGALKDAGGEVSVAAVCDSVASVANSDYYCGIVLDRSMRRQIASVATVLAAAAHEQGGDTRELLARAQGRLFELYREGSAAGWQHIAGGLARFFRDVDRVHAPGGKPPGIPTGIRGLDQLTTGLQPAELAILAGRPSNGKTAFALNVLHHVCVSPEGPRLPAAMFSLEMSFASLVNRMCFLHAGVDAHRGRSGTLGKEELGRLVSRAQAIAEANIYIEDMSDMNILELRAKAMKLRMQVPNLALVVVDYLQLMDGSGDEESRVREVAKISKGLKALAKEMGLPVLALSQLSRAADQRGSGRPLLSDLKESGALEQDADLVMFVHRPMKNKGGATEEEMRTVDLILAKQRNGPLGTVKLVFEGRYGRFEPRATAAEEAQAGPENESLPY